MEGSSDGVSWFRPQRGSLGRGVNAGLLVSPARAPPPDVSRRDLCAQHCISPYVPTATQPSYDAPRDVNGRGPDVEADDRPAAPRRPLRGACEPRCARLRCNDARHLKDVARVPDRAKIHGIRERRRAVRRAVAVEEARRLEACVRVHEGSTKRCCGARARGPAHLPHPTMDRVQPPVVSRYAETRHVRLGAVGVAPIVARGQLGRDLRRRSGRRGRARQHDRVAVLNDVGRVRTRRGRACKLKLLFTRRVAARSACRPPRRRAGSR